MEFDELIDDVALDDLQSKGRDNGTNLAAHDNHRLGLDNYELKWRNGGLDY